MSCGGRGPTPDPAVRARYLTTEQARAFLDAAKGDRLEALYSVAFSLGLGEGEALGLRWADFDFDARTVRVAKSLQRVPGAGMQLVEPKTKRSQRTLPMFDVEHRVHDPRGTAALAEPRDPRQLSPGLP